VINSKIVLPKRTLFKSKITCKGFTSMSSASTGRGDVNILKANSFPLFSLVDSWKNLGRVFAPTPSNLVKVECDYIKTDCWKDGRDRTGE
jgi:hypothetical protein